MMLNFFNSKTKRPTPDPPPPDPWTQKKLLHISQWLTRRERNLTTAQKKRYLFLFLAIGGAWFLAIGLKPIAFSSRKAVPLYMDQPMFTPMLPTPPPDTGLRRGLAQPNDSIQPIYQHQK